MNNIFSSLPDANKAEVFEEILSSGNVRIERIMSQGQSSPEYGWYDQDEHEWVVVLAGFGTLLFENGGEIKLNKGDYIHIPAHTRHKVVKTAADTPTIWLAVFYT